MRILQLILLLSLSNLVLAQTPVPRDTSFTIQSAYLKAKKQYPFIKIANPPLLKKVIEKDNIVYKNIGERTLSLDVFYPKKKIKNGYPAVILIYGGGWRSGDKSMCHPQAKILADNGYVAIAVEYRLSLEAIYPAAVEDVKAAVRWARLNAKSYHINPNKIATLGRSAGGQLAALVGTTNGNNKYHVGDNLEVSDDVQAIVNIDGVLAFHHPESSEGSAAELWLGGTSSEKPEIWAEASALTHTNKNSVPIIFINSSSPRFHAGRDDMIKILDQYHIYSEVHEFPNTPHPFWFFEPWFDDTMNYTINFLNKVLK